MNQSERSKGTTADLLLGVLMVHAQAGYGVHKREAAVPMKNNRGLPRVNEHKTARTRSMNMSPSLQ
jgi:hypothetical protein